MTNLIAEAASLHTRLDGDTNVCARDDEDWPCLTSRIAAELAAANATLVEIRMIPCWHNPETGKGGYDVDGEEWSIINDLLHGRTEPRVKRPMPHRGIRSDRREAATGGGEDLPVADLQWRAGTGRIEGGALIHGGGLVMGPMVPVATEGSGMSERERLLDLINATVKDDPYEGWNVREWDPKNPRDLDEQITDALLAAGFGDVAGVKTRIASTVAEMDALPVGSIVKGAADGEVIVGRKPHGNDFPNAVNGFWEVVGSELGTDAESILWDGPALVLYVPSATDSKGAVK